MIKIMHWIDDEIEELSPLIRQLEKKLKIIVKKYKSYKDFQRTYHPYPYEVILLDYYFPDDIDGLEILKILKSNKVSCPIIVVSAMFDVELTRNLFISGVTDIIKKGNLKYTINEIENKISFFNEGCEQKKLYKICSIFSSKEKMVFDLILKRLSDKEIIEKTELSFSNLRKYKRKIFDKFRDDGHDIKTVKDIYERFGK